MTRTGKIARLPLAIRSLLNKHLADGVPGVRLVDWLNTLPEVQQVLTEQFDGRAINEVNLTEWKGGGYLDWLARQDTLGCVQDVAEEAAEIKAASPVAVAEHLSVVLAARYAQLLSGWNGEMDEAFSKKLKGLRLLGQEIAVMRRENLRADRLELQKTQHRDTRKDKYVAALEYCVAEGKKWPEVEQAFRKAFVLLLAHARGTGGASARPQGDNGQGQTSNGQHSTSNSQAPSSSEAPKCEPHGPAGTGGTGGTGVRPQGDNGQRANIQHPTFNIQ